VWQASIVEGERRMLDTIENFSLTTLMVIVGPVLLALAMAYGVMQSRYRSRAARQQSDAETKSLYAAAADQERRTEGQDPGPLPR
jgi:hypothetical protein